MAEEYNSTSGNSPTGDRDKPTHFSLSPRTATLPSYVTTESRHHPSILEENGRIEGNQQLGSFTFVPIHRFVSESYSLPDAYVSPRNITAGSVQKKTAVATIGQRLASSSAASFDRAPFSSKLSEQHCPIASDLDPTSHVPLEPEGKLTWAPLPTLPSTNISPPHLHRRRSNAARECLQVRPPASLLALQLQPADALTPITIAFSPSLHAFFPPLPPPSGPPFLLPPKSDIRNVRRVGR
ncbi:hypothetical protein GGS23DRAFT_587591 [Durotheca rogersii]|uniref:uncharacterized protein n=1 Tax=Durotheca rogersii TaxID=419775 RepID=UPI00221FF3D9|nr:uncharacterized protein GGS23DRAFT_587591 [Durotheca rogersii]KAI5857470.1 hypothetical protein GGS23DRAFT_587591 [Durotheca rogersii]